MTIDSPRLPHLGDEAAALGRALGAPAAACDREAGLYARYVQALALLSECAPYVDEPDHAATIERVLAEANRHYPLEWPLAGGRPVAS